ncbi:hypothetical protein JTB14_006700 [Gonioctena quinquepunctata]|nr:hypothetical protein JTB14_006700 [Gonioctena quinquepunctata]
MNRWGFGLMRKELLDTVQQYVQSNQLKTPFKDGRLGEDWYLSFSKRHRLSLKKAELLEASRAKQHQDPFIIHDFFDKLESIQIENHVMTKPNCIWNADETGFSHDPKGIRVVAGVVEVAQRQSAGSGRDMTTVLACVNAAGAKMPPLILHKVVKGVKSTWNLRLADWQRRHIGEEISKSVFANILGEVWYSIKDTAIINGFRKTGVYPCDRSVIPKTIFDKEKLARYEKQNIVNQEKSDNGVQNKENITPQTEEARKESDNSYCDLGELERQEEEESYEIYEKAQGNEGSKFNPDVGNHIIVRLSGKKTRNHFVAIVDHSSNEEIRVKFLKRVEMSYDFIYPPKDDISFIDLEQIERIYLVLVPSKEESIPSNSIFQNLRT